VRSFPSPSLFFPSTEPGANPESTFYAAFVLFQQNAPPDPPQVFDVGVTTHLFLLFFLAALFLLNLPEINKTQRNNTTHSGDNLSRAPSQSPP